MLPVKAQFVIHVQPLAPAKPPLGAPCNGCGVCCLSGPCPLGMLLSRRRSGACQALRWDAAARQYRCGALTDTVAVLQMALPRGLRAVARPGAWLLSRLAGRWIAAGRGCDSSLLVQGGAGGLGDESDRQSQP